MTSGGSTRGRVALESQLLDRVQAAVMVTDLAGVVLFANPYCEVLYGRGADELVGEDAEARSPIPIAPEMVSEISDAIFGGQELGGRVPRRSRATGPAWSCTRSIRRCSTTTATSPASSASRST